MTYKRRRLYEFHSKQNIFFFDHADDDERGRMNKIAAKEKKKQKSCHLFIWKNNFHRGEPLLKIGYTQRERDLEQGSFHV